MSVACTTIATGAFAQAPAPAKPAPIDPLAPTTPAAAPATPTPSAADLAEAKKLFEAGLAFNKASQFQEALAAFTQSYRLAPRPKTLGNIAQTHRDLRDMASAYTAYELLLGTYGATMNPQDKTEVTRAIDELTFLTGAVAVTIDDPAATVAVDGKEVGPAPRKVRLNIGSHTVTVSKAGFDPIEQKVDIVGKENITIAGPLTATVTTGHVNVAVQPDNVPASVLVDGVEVGPAPWSGDLAAGPHVVSAKNPVGAAPASNIDVASKSAQDITLTIRRAVGTLRVSVDAFDALIQVDGNAVGSGSLFEGPIPTGRHMLDVTKPGYIPFRQSFEIYADERVLQSIALVREPSPTESGKPSWRGVYGRFDFIGLFGTSVQNNVANGSLYNSGTADSSLVMGGGLGLHIGYSFGWWGLEGVAAATYDHAEVSVNDPTAIKSNGGGAGRTDDWNFHRVGGTFALMGRFHAQTILRPTFGFGLGFSIKSLLYTRDVDSTGTSNTSDSTFYVTPTLLMDAGIELGSRAGSRFFLGGTMHIDVPTSQTLDSAGVTKGSDALPTGSLVRAALGPEVFIGPILGFRFGN